MKRGSSTPAPEGAPFLGHATCTRCHSEHHTVEKCIFEGSVIASSDPRWVGPAFFAEARPSLTFR